MKRTRRYILNTLTVVSLVLLLAVVGLWVDGYRHQIVVCHTDPGISPVFCSGRYGVVTGITVRDEGLSMPWLVGRTLDQYDPNGQPEIISHMHLIGSFDYKRAGFGYGWADQKLWTGVSSRYVILLPHWFLTLIFAILPAIWFVKWRKRRKLGPTACPSCGYDLTGNESGKCPECGVALIR